MDEALHLQSPNAILLEANIVAQKVKPSSVTIASHKGASSCSTCSTSYPVPCSGPCQPQGRPRWSSWLLTFAWISPIPCEHLRSEISRWKMFLSLSLSLARSCCNPDIQTNKSKKNYNFSSPLGLKWKRQSINLTSHRYVLLYTYKYMLLYVFLGIYTPCSSVKN